MKFAVIGCGSIGMRHISNLLDMGHQVVAYNRGETRRCMAKQRFGILTYACLETMLDTNTIDAVIICTSNSVHSDNLTFVVEQGLHFFVEKPLATDLYGLDKLETDITKKDLISHVGANMRYHFGPMTIKKYLDSGLIGRPVWANFWGGMYLPDWHPDEDYRKMYSAKKSLGGGAILDFIHEIDLICWMFGKPKQLAAMSTNTGCLDIETEDLVDVILAYENGTQINLHMDYLQRPFQRGIHIVGEKGSAKWDLTQESVQLVNYDNQSLKTISYPPGYIKNDMYLSQMDYFCKCIKEKKQSMSNMRAGVNALEIVQDIKKSISTHQFVEG